MHRTATMAALVIAVGSDSEIVDAVAVQITQRRQGSTEKVTVAEVGPVGRAGVDLDGLLHTAVAVEQQHMHRTATIAALVIVSGSDGEIVDAVAVQITQRRQRTTEIVTVVECGARWVCWS